MSRALKLVACTIIMLALSTGSAFAYSEMLGSMNPSATASSACPQCHGIEPGETSPTVGVRVVPSSWTWDSEAGLNVGSRKGPHGAYTAGTQKCQICHTMHGGGLKEGPILIAETIAATCLTCHDGTGGGGVYGVIAQRTGTDPTDPGGTYSLGTVGGVHRIGYLNGNSRVEVPGGDINDGSSLETTFSGSSGALTCSDCHNPHNSRTVAPFIGDRKRSSAEASTSAGLATNRLLRIKPTSALTTVTVYGNGWCASCHKKAHTGASFVGMPHSVQASDTLANYSSVTRLTGLNTSSTSVTPGTLGGNNFGYIMPDLNGTDPDPAHNGELPICQQCHEDSREVGSTYQAADQFWVTTTQAFAPPLDGDVAGNPRFQNFPHESVNDGLLIETDDGLCANCHCY